MDNSYDASDHEDNCRKAPLIHHKRSSVSRALFYLLSLSPTFHPHIPLPKSIYLHLILRTTTYIMTPRLLPIFSLCCVVIVLTLSTHLISCNDGMIRINTYIPSSPFSHSTAYVIPTHAQHTQAEPGSEVHLHCPRGHHPTIISASFAPPSTPKERLIQLSAFFFPRFTLS